MARNKTGSDVILSVSVTGQRVQVAVLVDGDGDYGVVVVVVVVVVIGGGGGSGGGGGGHWWWWW